MKLRRIPGRRSRFFQGEIMVCANCGRCVQSDPKIESGWTVLEIDQLEPIYICPACFGSLNRILTRH